MKSQVVVLDLDALEEERILIRTDAEPPVVEDRPECRVHPSKPPACRVGDLRDGHARSSRARRPKWIPTEAAVYRPYRSIAVSDSPQELSVGDISANQV